jgi:Flp pilus assembly protein TadD
VAKASQTNAAFHEMVAMVAIGLNNITAAERHFNEAARLDPENKLMQLNQAIIHLQAKDQQVAAAALKTLERLYEDPVYHCDALRHLAMAASRNKDYSKAAVFTKELQADSKAPLSDRMMHLSVLKDGGSPEFAAYLDELSANCSEDADQVNVLTAWLLAHGLASQAADWLESLPAEVREKRPVTLARADCVMARKDWPGLQRMLENAKWAELDFMRLAMLARARREQRQELAAQADWRLAVRIASERANPLKTLARMAKEWDWEKEEEEILWLIVQRFPAERWTLQALNRHYLATGNTRGLWRVYSTLLGYDSSDAAAQNNFAAVSLLLNLQITKAHEMARAAYSRFPNNEAFASTYAYSLHLQGKTKDALRIFELLKSGQLQQPGVAVYYGTVLVANGESGKARQYLQIAEKGRLLPEEKAMVDQARKQL